MKIINKLKTNQKIFLFSILIIFSIALFDILSMGSGVGEITIKFLKEKL